jgi:hypothetical protein
MADTQTGDKVLAAIVNFVKTSETDVQNALDMATKAGNNVTIQAWTALLAFMKQIDQLNTNLPAAHLATDIELLTEITQALQPGSALVVAFSALAQYQTQSAASMVTGIVTGAISLTKLIPVLPTIPL